MIALESGAHPLVAYIRPTWQWLSPSFRVKASDLMPLPMAYFHGDVPR